MFKGMSVVNAAPDKILAVKQVVGYSDIEYTSV